jgi:hypothetical protein
MKANKAKDLAFGQFKTIFMTMFSFYFIAGNLSLFTIFIVGLYAYNSLSSILNVNTCNNIFIKCLNLSRIMNTLYGNIN